MFPAIDLSWVTLPVPVRLPLLCARVIQKNLSSHLTKLIDFGPADILLQSPVDSCALAAFAGGVDHFVQQLAVYVLTLYACLHLGSM